MTSMTQLQAIRYDLKSALAKIDALLEYESPTEQTTLPELEMVRAMPRTKAIEWVLERASGTSLRPVEIWSALQMYGRDDPKMEIQVTTFDLWQRGRIGKTGRGQYCALTTQT